MWLERATGRLLRPRSACEVGGLYSHESADARRVDAANCANSADQRAGIFALVVRYSPRTPSASAAALSHAIVTLIFSSRAHVGWPSRASASSAWRERLHRL